ncbi:MAG: helix-turn-helix transcriptional regulator, partial [Limisphaerales bacterium]
QRHTLAVLRTIIGITQKEMAQLAECSPPTIQAVELGKLKLSEKLGGLIALRTGIALKWLLDDNVASAPVTEEGHPFTEEVYHQTQSFLAAPSPSQFSLFQPMISFQANVFRLANVLLKAHKDKKSALCAYKIAKAMDELDREFGMTDDDTRFFATKMLVPNPDKPTGSASDPLFTTFNKTVQSLSPKFKPPAYDEPIRFTITPDGQLTKSTAPDIQALAKSAKKRSEKKAAKKKSVGPRHR